MMRIKMGGNASVGSIPGPEVRTVPGKDELPLDSTEYSSESSSGGSGGSSFGGSIDCSNGSG